MSIKNPTAAFEAARVAATGIIRAQKAGEILASITAAKEAVVASIRAFAVALRNQAKADKAVAEEEAKRTDNREAFTQSLGKIEGLTAEELAATTAAVEKDRKEQDEERTKKAEAVAKAAQEEVERFQKRLTGDKEKVTKLEDELAKVQSGESTVDQDEVDALASELTEKALGEGAIDDINDAAQA